MEFTQTYKLYMHLVFIHIPNVNNGFQNEHQIKLPNEVLKSMILQLSVQYGITFCFLKFHGLKVQLSSLNEQKYIPIQIIF